MFHLIGRDEVQPSENRTVEFEGGPYGGGVSFILVDNEPGQGPSLHTHPYSETWFVRSGRALFSADGKELEAGPGDVLVVEAETPHGFRNLGPGRLELVCIHAAGKFQTEWLDT